MYKSFYENSDLLIYPMFALLFFVGFFTMTVATSFARARLERDLSLSRLPLEDETEGAHGP